jgi:glutamate-1-semialdehyde 2,1-aminomutase
MTSKEGIALWDQATSIIPGGNGLLSKRPDRYAPDIWPTYFSECLGVNVTDLDENSYVDMAQMGIGSAILGYANPELVDAVCRAAKSGVNCTLNCPEEVELGGRLLELNPFAGGVKFARTGGEAMAMAIRIARAASGRAKVMFSGYHGWSDWYLAANLGDPEGLSNHLLPGLEPKGVPVGLKNSAIPFLYNDVADFERVLDQHSDIGVICIEGARYDFPNPDFLDAIIARAKQHNIVVISDEITSGWRMTDGGVYKLNGFEPDIVVYAKAMGGGFAISAVIGRENVMDVAQDTFMSSTMWTERVGFVAGLKTIEVLTREKGWEQLIQIGERISEGWEMLAERHGLRLKTTEFKPLITFKLDYGDLNNDLITLYIQEMLKRGYLAASSVYVSMAHTTDIVDRYLEVADEVFSILAKAINHGDVGKLLETKPRSDAFVRLTK